MEAVDPFQGFWQWLRDLTAAPSWAQLALVAGVLAVGALVLLALLLMVLRLLFGRKAPTKQPKLEEDLSTYPPLKASGGDRRLTVEGVPVRLRLVVLAPAGKHAEVTDEQAEATLERMLPGLGPICTYDKPRIRIWPTQLSYQGFARLFHASTRVPEPAGELSPWILVAGRAKLGKHQVMVGLALQAPKPTTVGRLTLEAHEWDSKLRVRVRE